VAKKIREFVAKKKIRGKRKIRAKKLSGSLGVSRSIPPSLNL